MKTKVLLTPQDLADWVKECNKFWSYFDEHFKETIITFPCLVIYNEINDSSCGEWIDYSFLSAQDLKTALQTMANSH